MLRKTVFLFSLFLSLVISGERPVVANILANSSFETTTYGTGIPDGWKAECFF